MDKQNGERNALKAVPELEKEVKASAQFDWPSAFALVGIVALVLAFVLLLVKL